MGIHEASWAASCMATGGAFGVEDIKYFNGGLFNDDQVLALTART